MTTKRGKQKMKALYWIAGEIGAVLTPFAIVNTWSQRGYFAIGGEWFIAPLFLMIVAIIDMGIHGGRLSWEEETKEYEWNDEDDY